MYGLGEVSILWKLWIPDWGSETSRICWRGQRAGEINIDSSAQKEYFLLKRTFPNSELYITSRHFIENLPRRFSCPLNGVFDCFGAVRTPGNGIVFWVMATKKQEYVKASSVVAKVVQGVGFLRCELCEGFCQTQSVFGGLRPSKHCLLPILDRVWRRRRMQGAIFKEILINCTFVT